MSSESPVAGTTSVTVPLRIRLFVDFWNLQLLLNERETTTVTTVPVAGARFFIDWQKLPECFVQKAAALLRISNYTYDGTIVFTSFNAKTDEGKSFRRWATGWLERQPGIQVTCFERRPRSTPRCHKCHRAIENCSTSRLWSQAGWNDREGSGYCDRDRYDSTRVGEGLRRGNPRFVRW